jgi:hypothetical protein
MDPAYLFGTVVSAVEAAKAIQELLMHADQLAKDDAQYYATYLAVASKAIEGIEGEYLGILMQAAEANLDNAKELKKLQKRITNYIHGEVLRPRLRDSINRLREGRAALKEHSDSRLIWPKVKVKRAAALAKFDELLNVLDGYLGSLGDYAGPSATALEDLRSIQSDLSKEPLDTEAFAEKIDDLLMNLDKSNLISTTADCGRIIETLRIAFR